MSHTKLPASMLIAILLLGLGFGLLLAYQSAVPSEVTAAHASDNWPILRHDSGHSGYNPNVGSFRPPLVLLDTIDLQDLTGDPHGILNVVTGYAAHLLGGH